MNLEKMKVAELRDELEKRGLDTKGTKPFLVQRLQEALDNEGGGAVVGGEDGGSAPMDQEEGDAQEDEEEEEEQEEEMENGGESEEVAAPVKTEKAAAVAATPPKAAAQTNGDVKDEKTEAKTEPKSEKKPGSGVKRKFGEISANIEEMKPWTVREDEPEMKEGFVCLDWYNSDLNLKIRHDEFLSAMPLNRESWSWVYAGCRATYGVKTGKVFYEVKYNENMRVYTEMDGGHLDLRVGWSLDNASLMLGENAASWCYSSAGKKAHNSVFEEYGVKLEKGDVFGAALDMEGDDVIMTFKKNGEDQGEAFKFPKADLNGQALFPAILTRNTKFTGVFGKDKDGKDVDAFKPIEGFTQIGKLEVGDLVRGNPGIAKREDCEFIMMVGLPAAGKSTWAKKYVAENPDKRFEILNASEYLERATLWGESRKKHTEVTWEKVNHRLTKAIQDVLKVASQRRRNIILDQTNVYVDAQVRKARPFQQFKRKCVVVVPSTEEWDRRKTLQKESEDATIPDDAMGEMKANISFLLEDNMKDYFDELVFPELDREAAQQLLETYNKEARDAGFGKKHEQYQKEWEQNKKMRGMGGRGGGRFMRGGGGAGFGNGGKFGGGRGGAGMGGGFRGGRPNQGFGGGMRQGFGGGYGGGAYGAAGGGFGNFRGGYGGAGGYGGGSWAAYGYGGGNQGGYGGQGGYGANYPGNRNWGGWN